MIADGDGLYKKSGYVDEQTCYRGFGMRSWRYSAFIVDGEVEGPRNEQVKYKC